MIASDGLFNDIILGLPDGAFLGTGLEAIAMPSRCLGWGNVFINCLQGSNGLITAGTATVHKFD